jgi:alginate O-acetyltransferase complex protein AlgI
VFFNSHLYLLIFLPITLIVYLFLVRYSLAQASKVWLVLASLFFYAWSNPAHLYLLLGSLLLNFLIWSALLKLNSSLTSGRRMVFILGIAANIAFLGYFKYADFFITNVNHLFHAHYSLLHLAFPLAVSFFTFTQIAYLTDTYRGKVEKTGFLNYSLFVTFFPYLLSGPIVRHSEMMPQFESTQNRSVNYKNLSLGLYILSIGLIKKVFIADEFAQWATGAFDTPMQLNFLYAWAASLSYTFQIYFDFSGYTDMAIGAALMFNIRLPINFNSPYKALDIQDFWRRWHITLSRFLRDYIYIPLGGNRVQEGHLLLNLMITFLIGGIWHGAGWTFVFWGFLHGLATVIHRLWKMFNIKLPKTIAWALTFGFVNVAWVFFRARTWGDAMRVLSGMFGLNGLTLPEEWSNKLAFLKGSVLFSPWKQIMPQSRDAYLWILCAFLACLLLRNSNELAERFKPNWWSLLVVAGAVYAILHIFRAQEFFYFNF